MSKTSAKTPLDKNPRERAAAYIQSRVRGRLTRRAKQAMTRAATKIQAITRGNITKKREGAQVKLKLSSVLKMQSVVRAFQARKKAANVREEKEEAAAEMRQIQAEQDAFDCENTEPAAADSAAEAACKARARARDRAQSGGQSRVTSYEAEVSARWWWERT